MFTIVTNPCTGGSRMPENNPMAKWSRQLRKYIARFVERLKFSVILPARNPHQQTVMASFFQQFTLTQLSFPAAYDVLKINREQPAIKSILSVTKFRDRDTLQFGLFISSLHLTIKGETLEKAAELLYFSLKEIFEQFVSMPAEKVEEQLFKLGWRKNGSFNHSYHHLTMVSDGDDPEFNALKNSVEYLSLTAA